RARREELLRHLVLNVERLPERGGNYLPFQDTVQTGLDAARLAHLGWTLARAGRRAEANRVLREVEVNETLAARAFCLLAIGAGAKAGDARGHARALESALGPHGRFV